MQDKEQEFSFKSLFIPLTTFKAIHIIIILGFLVFGNMLFNEFVADDNDYIINNPQVHQADLFSPFTPNNFNRGGQYRPIPELYFSLLYASFKTIPFFYHFIQLILHITVTILLYFVFRKFISPVISLFLALVFLVHPINVESVGYIAQTVSPLFSLFGLIALLMFMKKKLTLRTYIAIFAFLSLSILAKETGVLFMLLVIFHSLIFNRKNLQNLISGSVIVFIAYGFIRIFIGQVGLSTRLLAPIASLSLPERVLNFPMIIFYYLKQVFFPQILTINQQWVVTSINFSTFYFPLMIDLSFFILLALVGLLIFKKYRKFFNSFLFLTIWFLIGLLFHIQIFPLDKTVADTWFYFPLVGLLGLLGLMLQPILIKFPKLKFVFLFLSIIIVVSLSGRTIIRIGDWKDQLTLYTRDIKYNNTFELAGNLGYTYASIGKYDKAIEYYKRSVALRPHEFNLHNVGIDYVNLGDMQQAEEYFAKALSANNYKLSYPHKHDSITYKSYITTLIYHNNYPKALQYVKEALADYPDDVELHTYLALISYSLQNHNEAVNAARKAYLINPDDQEVAALYKNIQNNQSFNINLYKKIINFNSINK